MTTSWRRPRVFCLCVLSLTLLACPDDPPPPTPDAQADGGAPDVQPDAGADSDLGDGDQTGPTVVVTSPTPNQQVNGAVVEVTGTVVDEVGPNDAAATGLETLTVNGTEVTPDATGAFVWTVTNLSWETPTLTVVATDVAGNETVVDVPLDVTRKLYGLQVDPFSIFLTRAGDNVQLDVKAMFDGAYIETPAAGLTYASGDSTIAAVNASGVVTANAQGKTDVTVSFEDQSITVPVTVEIDIDPPLRPRLFSYSETTDLPTQIWIGRTEPGARLTVEGAAVSPVEAIADELGRVKVSVVLTPGVSNPITITVTDTAGNASEAYAFPVTHDPGYIDPGSVHRSDGDMQSGHAGEPLLKPLVVRATDVAGDPLFNAEITFAVVAGNGRVATSKGGPWIGGTHQTAAITVKTNGMGYAQVFWELDDNPGSGNQLCAKLAGDTEVPSFFTAFGKAAFTGAPTTLSGLVLDEHSRAVRGATVHLQGTPISTQTDSRGKFTIRYPPFVEDPTEPQLVSVLVDGSTAEATDGRFATISFETTLLPSQDNRVLRPFFVPFIPLGVAIEQDAEGLVTAGVTLSKSFAAGQAPTRLHIPVGTRITWPAGIADEDKRITLIDIPTGQTPMPLPDGLFTRHVIAVQPHGTVFEPPLPLETPNVDGLTPGKTIPLNSWDHDANRFVPVGTATVTNDGSYIVSDPGSGIKFGAWHFESDTAPPWKCTVKGRLESQAKGRNCICRLSNGDVVKCEPGKSFDAPGVPCDGSVDVVQAHCEGEDDKPIRIITPTKSAKGVVIVPLNTPIQFVAATLPAGNEGDAEWTVLGVPAGTGAVMTHTFTEEKPHLVMVDCANSAECEGNDTTVVIPMDCCVAGTVRACADNVTLNSPTDMTLSGNVTVGRGEAQFLKVSGQVKCDIAGAKLTGEGSWKMDTKSLFGSPQPNDLLYVGPWEIDGKDGAIKFGNDTNPGSMKVTIVGFEMGNAPGTIQSNAVGFKAPPIALGLGCAADPDDCQVQVAFDSFAVTTRRKVLGGKFAFTGNFVVIPPEFFVVKKFEVGFDASTGVLAGAFGFQTKLGSLEISGEYAEGRVRKLAGVFELPSFSPITKGQPIAGTPLFLRSVDITIQNPGLIFDGGKPIPGVVPSIEGGLTFSVGPGITLPFFCDTYSAAVFRAAAKVDLIPLAFEASLTGTFGTFSPCDKDKDHGIFSAFLKGRLEIEPKLKFILSGGAHTNNLISVLPASMRTGLEALKEAGIEFDTENMIQGAAELAVSGEETTVKLSGSLAFPKVTLGAFEFGPKKLAGFELNMLTSGAKGKETFKGDGAAEATIFVGFFPVDVKAKVSFTPDKGFGFTACFESLCIGSIELERRLFNAADATFEVPTGLDSLEVTLTVPGGGDVQFNLVLPDGTTLAFDDPTTITGPHEALLVQGLPALQSTWMLKNPPAGTWEVVSVAGSGVPVELVIAIPDHSPVIALVEPFTQTATDVTVGWNAADADSDATIALTFGPTRDAAKGEPMKDAAGQVADIQLSDGVSEFVWSLADVPPGLHFVCARISDGDSLPAEVCSDEPVRVTSASGLVPPLLVRGQWSDEGLTVSWLESSPATASAYGVRLVPVGGGQSLGRGVAKTTRALFVNADRTLDYEVTVTSATDGASSRPVIVPADPTRLHITSRPPTQALVDATWTYAVTAAGGGGPDAVVVAVGPPGMSVAGSTLTFTPSDGQSGLHQVTVQVSDAAGGTAALQTFELAVAAAEASLAPVITSRPGTTDVEVGVLFTYSPVVNTVETGALTFSLLHGPPGMTIDGAGTVSWTPTLAEAAQANGVDAFTIEVATDSGKVGDQTTTLRFQDPDGDLLPTEYELASGLDPFAVDVASDDPDGDGLSHTQEVGLGTRGDTADSDGDGVDDKAEADGTSDPRNPDTDGDTLDDGAEAAAGSDPTLADTDGDLAKDADEVAQGTSPTDAPVDTDGDGLFDHFEQFVRCDPALADTDDDGLEDDEELEAGTDCREADSDGDTVPDGREVANETDPASIGEFGDDELPPDLARELGLDLTGSNQDGDAFNDQTEVAMGTDPLDPSDSPAVAPGDPNPKPNLRGGSEPKPFDCNDVTDVGTITVQRDDDMDGVADSYEETHEHDKDDPADSESDKDGDGLTLLQEFQSGTNPNAVDTDGDTVSDAQELIDQTDPNDASDFSDNGPVTSLTVKPDLSKITSNTFFGPASLQFIVTGHRDDGTTVNLTDASTATTYSASDNGLVSITSDGLLVHTMANGDGQVTVTVSNGSHSVDAIVDLETFTPLAVAAVPLDGSAGVMAVDGQRLVLASSSALLVFDVTIPELPELRGSVELGGAAQDVALVGGRAVVALGDAGVVVVDVDDMDEPKVAMVIPLGKEAVAVALGGSHAYVATDAGVLTVNATPPGAVTLMDANGDGTDDRVLSTADASVSFLEIDWSFGRVVAGTSSELRVYAPTLNPLTGGTSLTFLDILDTGTHTMGILSLGAMAYYVGAGRLNRAALSPSPFSVAASGADQDQEGPLALVGDFVAAGRFTNTARVGFFDATNVGFVGSTSFDPLTGFGSLIDMGVEGEYHYVSTAGPGGHFLCVGRHSKVVDLLGVPPEIVILSPAPSAVIEEGTLVTFAVQVTDDVKVDTVQLRIDGAPIADLSGPPWEVTYRLPNIQSETPMFLTATATDVGGNSAEMIPVAITNEPMVDPLPPTVEIISPAAGAAFAGGVAVTVDALATDDRVLASVEFAVDGTVVDTVTEPPFTTSVLMPLVAANPDKTVSVTAVATDYADNTAVSEVVLNHGGIDLVAQGVSSIADTDQQFEGADILIEGGTVDISGAHTFGRVSVGTTGVLTHPQTPAGGAEPNLHLTADEVIINAGGRIDVSSKGYLGSCLAPNDCSGAYGVGNLQATGATSGAGSHGGLGAHTNNGTSPPIFGDMTAPVTLGGGGFGNLGGHGGGRVRIDATTLTLDGDIVANGGDCDYKGVGNVGAGAGGSVYITVTTLAGGGSIHADGGIDGGGDNHLSNVSAGGGGRVAVYADDASGFDLARLTAFGGQAARAGSAGTVYTVIAGGTPQLRIDGGVGPNRGPDTPWFGDTATGSPVGAGLDLTVATAGLVLLDPLDCVGLTIAGAGRVQAFESVTATTVTLTDSGLLVGGPTTLTYESTLLVTATTIDIGAAAAIDVSEQGYLGDCVAPNDCNGGIGEGNLQANGAGERTGGSHGGLGGQGGSLAPPPVYGDPNNPDTLGGGGGGHPFTTNELGGNGGGRVRVVASSLTLDGSILANGGDGTGTSNFSSGGAGGSIRIIVDDLAGTGAVVANGGTGLTNATSAGGGGGRIAIDVTNVTTFDFTPVQCLGGVPLGGGPAGAAGTVVINGL